MFLSPAPGLRFQGGLPDSYWTARREAPQRRALLADAADKLEQTTERVLRDLVAAIAYQSQTEGAEQQVQARQETQRLEMVLAHKLQQMGGANARITAAARNSQIALLNTVEETLDAMDSYHYKIPQILTSALLLALERLNA